tara:strand:+ start:41357 stop:41581 length:225 start_codon:yes stop_codon:yes gene_type:complete
MRHDSSFSDEELNILVTMVEGNVRPTWLSASGLCTKEHKGDSDSLSFTSSTGQVASHAEYFCACGKSGGSPGQA